MGLGGFTVYKRKFLMADKRAEKLRLVEEKFCSENPENMIKSKLIPLLSHTPVSREWPLMIKSAK